MTSLLRRSSLYIPGDIEKMLRKASGLPADLLLLNLEDGVSTSRKGEARENVVRVLRESDFGAREVVVRVNSPGTETGKRDLDVVVQCGPDGLCLPKVDSAGDIREADDAVSELERAHGLEPGRLRFHAMIESARGVLEAASIARASPRMSSLIFGSADFITDVRCHPDPNREELLLALQQIVLAAHAAGIDAIDSPCFDLRNLQLLRQEAEQARRIGFDGKNALHPSQLETINEVFSVTAEEIRWAHKVVSELEDAEHRGRSLSTLEGHLIDNPHLSLALRILDQAALIGKAGSADETHP